MLYEEAKEHIIEKLRNHLSPNLHYHCLEHTFDVLNTVEMYAIAEGVNDHDMKLLQTAALYHDAGFIHGYKGHELSGRRMVEEDLPQFCYLPEDIHVISKMVNATSLAIEPENLLEEIICDADLDYLGREDFFMKSQKLKIEFLERNIIANDKEWEYLQINFLKSHRFYTKTAKKLRDPLKQHRIFELEEMYARY